jgi:hypothetical protein
MRNSIESKTSAKASRVYQTVFPEKLCIDALAKLAEGYDPMRFATTC